MYRSQNLLLLLSFIGTLGCAVVLSGSGGASPDEPLANPCPGARESALPLPSTLANDAYEGRLYAFIQQRAYDDLGWCVDKGVRDTGPWIDSTYYGTHPAVRIYYSPRMMYWLTGDPAFLPPGERGTRRAPREGAVPDGAMIVKEMFAPPAARYDGLSAEALDAILLDTSEGTLSSGWTVMVKDAAGAKDGWYWSEIGNHSKPDVHGYPFAYPASGFGQYCLRCHAAAERELTFSALRNIEGFPGDPVTFWVDNSWRTLPAGERPYPSEHDRDATAAAPPLPPVEPNADFLAYFSSIPRVAYASVEKFPGENLDRVVAGPDGPEAFLTSDQCMMCHSGDSGPYGPVMFLKSGQAFGQGVNVSPYGEWRWSPMGLAGRDPIFHAQLESEIAILRKEFADAPGLRDSLVTATVNTCLSCHGVMGKRQFDIDQDDAFADFQLDWLYITDPKDPHFKYGALARDGISCATCHHSRQADPTLEAFLMNSVTGQFKIGPPDELAGPFEDVTTFPMEEALGITPKHDPYIQSSRMCGSCHTINLPIVGKAPGAHPQLDRAEKNPVFQPYAHGVEQATYLEWLNSQYQNEVGDVNPATAQTCQGCHMPTGFHNDRFDIDTLKTKIADFEDQDYPEADNRAALDDVRVRFREEGYRRHRLQGLNIYLVSMFDQFNDILGVRKSDYMSGAPGLPVALDGFVQQARERTATLDVSASLQDARTLVADVVVENKTGHRFPSGVGFRRAFLEVLVLQERGGRERVVWGSGRTNAIGVFIDGNGHPLPTESFEGGRYQPHHERITREDQVQIYEELSQNAQGAFTTSFIHRDTTLKENRLLPKGWKPEGPDPALYPKIKDWIDATHPEGAAAHDPDYENGEGRDHVRYEITLPPDVDPATLTVRATLYYQSIPPYYLAQRFSDVPEGPDGAARRRLYYLTSNLRVAGTPIENWKLRLVSDAAQVQ